MATLLRLIGSLPLLVLHALGSMLGRLAYALHAPTRERQDRNLAQATPFLGQKVPSAQIARETGKQMLEMLWIWRNHFPTKIAPKVHMDALSREIVEKPGATIFLTPHLGPFEVTGQMIGAIRPFTVMYRKPRKPWLDTVMLAGRNKGGTMCVPADTSGVRAMFKALKRGEAIGILPDQTPAAGEGAWVPLFGKPAYTMTLIASLALKTDARLVMCIGKRLPKARGFVVRAYELPALPAATADDPNGPTAMLNAHVQMAIAHTPAQYMWSYNRYKQPGGAPPPPDAM